jgi:CheY-like chemotaxis protein/HPt (histidine-containing phosphotransfer) domain-containing protein
VAEDNVVNQKVALRVLEKLGYRAEAVANGQEALEALETIPYDLVLMDVQMPEMDGFEATRVIRDPESRVLNQSTPIVAMTAHAMKGDRERCLEAGMDDYLTKPIDQEELLAAIERWVKKSKSDLGTVIDQGAEGPPSESAIDLDQIMGRLGGDRTFLKEIIGVFLTEGRQQLDLLRASVLNQDYETTLKVAHRLKGAAANLSAVGVQKAASALEVMAEDRHLQGVSANLTVLERELGRVSDYSKVFLGGEDWNETGEDSSVPVQ